jgi:hypothetical protein
MAQRVYIPFTLFNMQMVNMAHLWEPSREYKGQATQKPNWFHTCRTPKTRPNWWEEPALAPAWAAYSELLSKSGMNAQMVTEWPIKDGDMPAEPGQPPAEWAKGHWVLGGSSSQGIKVEIVQGGGACVPLTNRAGVKPGDYVALGLSAAIKQNNARGLKHFANTVLFMSACAPEQEIQVGGSSISGTELMRQAQAQGLQPQGFTIAQPAAPYPGTTAGFPGSPQAPVQGFAPTQPGPTFQPQGAPSFNPGGAGPGMPQSGGAGPGMPQSGGPAYTPASGTPVMNSGPTAPNGAYPSNPQPGQWAPPPNFAPGGPR